MILTKFILFPIMSDKQQIKTLPLKGAKATVIRLKPIYQNENL